MTDAMGWKDYIFSSNPFLISTKAPFCAIIFALYTEGGAFFMGEQKRKKNISVGLLAHVSAV